MELHTPLCDELGIEYPIFSVGFGLGAPPKLAAAVSNAGWVRGRGKRGQRHQPAGEIVRDLVREAEEALAAG